MTASPLEELRAKEAKLRADIASPAITEVDIPRSFFPEQLGLREIMCDELGRLWDTSQRPTIKMIFDPMWLHPDKRWTRVADVGSACKP